MISISVEAEDIILNFQSVRLSELYQCYYLSKVASEDTGIQYTPVLFGHNILTSILCCFFEC